MGGWRFIKTTSVRTLRALTKEAARAAVECVRFGYFLLSSSDRAVLPSHGRVSRRDMLNSAHAVCWPSLIWIVIKQVMHHSMSSSEQISSSNKHSSSSQLQSSSSKMSTQELTSSLSELKSNMTEMKSSLSSHLVAAAAAAAAQSSAVAKFPSAGLLQGKKKFSVLYFDDSKIQKYFFFPALNQDRWKD
jgi:hypothetical protein